jgi:hypothetical protein
VVGNRRHDRVVKSRRKHRVQRHKKQHALLGCALLMASLADQGE